MAEQPPVKDLPLLAIGKGRSGSDAGQSASHKTLLSASKPDVRDRSGSVNQGASGVLSGRLGSGSKDISRMPIFRVEVLLIEPNQLPIPKNPASSVLPATISGKNIALLEFHETDISSFRSLTKLKHIHEKLVATVQNVPRLKFCSEDGIAVAEDINLDSYISHMKNPPSFKDVKFRVYVKRDGDPPPTTATMIDKPPFLLSFIRILPSSGNVKSEGSLHSNSLQGKSAGSILMSSLRQAIEYMSSDDSFCLLNGTNTGDTVTLSQYLAMTNNRIEWEDQVPRVQIYYSKKGESLIQAPGSKGISSTNSKKPGGQVAVDIPKLNMSFTDISNREIKRDQSVFKVAEQINMSEHAVRSAEPKIHTSQMTEKDWASVIQNCSALYGWRFDLERNKIVRAPYAAFKLRKGLNIRQASTDNTSTNTATKGLSALKAISSTGSNILDSSLQSTTLTTPDAINHSKNEVTPNSVSAPGLSNLAPYKPDAIPSWSINDSSRIEISVVQHDFQWSMAKNHFTAASYDSSGELTVEGVGFGSSTGLSNQSSSGDAAAKSETSRTMIAKYKFPRVTLQFPPEQLELTDELKELLYSIRDNKNISDLRKIKKLFGHIFCQEIVLGGCLQSRKQLSGTTAKTEKEERDKFKAAMGQSVAIPGVGKGSNSMSFEKQSSTAQGSTTTDTTETAIFEATGGNTLLAADAPAWSQSIADFNYWRIIDQSEVAPLADIISQFPGFEDVETWFLQVIPTLTDYIAIPSSRAVDVRFKLLGRPDALKSPQKEEVDERIVRFSSVEANQVYLGHNPNRSSVGEPVRLTLQVHNETHLSDEHFALKDGKWVTDLREYTTQFSEDFKEVLFHPPSAMGPALLGTSYKAVSSQTDQTWRFTRWRIHVPYGNALEHDSLISITSLSDKDDPAQKVKKENADGSNQLEVVALGIMSRKLSLSVYRNAQGVFLPCISDSDTPSFWRILKSSLDEDNGFQSSSEPTFKDGDSARLCWRFEDQVAGFRDYYDDIYGHNRFSKPADFVGDDLFLKVPYPRLWANPEPGIGLVMSTADTQEPILESISVIDKNTPAGLTDVMYNLFDLTFRVDLLSSGGVGETVDYMNVKSEGDTVTRSSQLINTVDKSKPSSAGDVLERTVENAGKWLNEGVENVVNGVFDGSAFAIASRFIGNSTESIGKRLASFFN